MVWKLRRLFFDGILNVFFSSSSKRTAINKAPHDRKIALNIQHQFPAFELTKCKQMCHKVEEERQITFCVDLQGFLSLVQYPIVLYLKLGPSSLHADVAENAYLDPSLYFHGWILHKRSRPLKMHHILISSPPGLPSTSTPWAPSPKPTKSGPRARSRTAPPRALSPCAPRLVGTYLIRPCHGAAHFRPALETKLATDQENQA